MKFHLPSYLLGAASAVVVMKFPERLRPVIVELGAIAETILRTGRTIVERQREGLEDLWAEISDRATQKMRQTPVNGHAHSPAAGSPSTSAAQPNHTHV